MVTFWTPPICISLDSLAVMITCLNDNWLISSIDDHAAIFVINKHRLQPVASSCTRATPDENPIRRADC